MGCTTPKKPPRDQRKPKKTQHPLKRSLDKLYPRRWLNATARATGAVKRQRVVNIVTLLLVLALGFNTRTLAGLHRAYQKASHTTLTRGAFYKRFTPGLVKLLHECALRGIEELASTAPHALQEHLRAFKDVLAQDSTVVRLLAALAKKWPATRARKVAAGVKVSVVVSVVANSVKSVRLFGERVSEVKTLRLGPWVKDRVLLIDLGFFKYQFFARIREYGGFFVSRLKENADPVIVALHRTHRGRSIDVVGKRLSEVLPKLKRGVLDVEVEVSFRRRGYKGKRRGDSQRFRLVAVLNEETGKYHVYLTNISPDVLKAEDIAALYAARWEVELLFKECKSHYAFAEVKTENPRVVEALVWAGIVTLLVSRSVYRVVTQYYASDPEMLKRFTQLRWAAVFAENAADLLAALLGFGPDFSELLRRFRLQALDPNVQRERLLDKVRA